MKTSLKLKTVLLAPLAVLCLQPVNAQQSSVDPAAKLRINGYIGKRIDDCIALRVKGQDADHLVEPFRHRKEKSRFICLRKQILR